MLPGDLFINEWHSVFVISVEQFSCRLMIKLVDDDKAVIFKSYDPVSFKEYLSVKFHKCYTKASNDG